jgi:hypothetical protein
MCSQVKHYMFGYDTVYFVVIESFASLSLVIGS